MGAANTAQQPLLTNKSWTALQQFLRLTNEQQQLVISLHDSAIALTSYMAAEGDVWEQERTARSEATKTYLRCLRACKHHAAITDRMYKSLLHDQYVPDHKTALMNPPKQK